MFAAQAHSFKQQARLAISLSWIAGYTNVLTLLACGQATSHVSGTASNLGRSIAESHFGETLYLASAILVFFAGAILSGVLTELGHIRRWDSIFVLPMTIEAVLLAIFAVLVDWQALGNLPGTSGRVWLTLVPAAAMGLQNATITRISGGVVRTTHVTGVVTDLGIETAALFMRRLDADGARRHPGGVGTALRAALLASITGSFVVGAGLGTLAWLRIPEWSMIPAVAFLIWIIWQDLRRPIASIRTNRDVGGNLHESLPPDVAVYHIRSRNPKHPRRGRLPNLTAWADHLPKITRVVVLDLAEADLRSSNEFLEIRSLADRLSADDIDLILSGVTDQHYAMIRQVGLHRAIPSNRILMSMEDAISAVIGLPPDDLSTPGPASGSSATNSSV